MIFILKPHKANPCRILKLKLISSYPENFLAKNLNNKLILSFLLKCKIALKMQTIKFTAPSTFIVSPTVYLLSYNKLTPNPSPEKHKIDLTKCSRAWNFLFVTFEVPIARFICALIFDHFVSLY